MNDISIEDKIKSLPLEHQYYVNGYIDGILRKSKKQTNTTQTKPTQKDSNYSGL